MLRSHAKSYRISNIIIYLHLILLLLIITKPGWTSTHYVWSGGKNISPYDTWDKASTALSLAYLSAVNGDTIEIAGGTYSELSDWNKQLTVKSTNIRPYAGKVIIDGGHLFSAKSLVFESIYFTAITSGSPFRCNNGCSINFNNCQIGPFTSASSRPLIYGGDIVFNRCRFTRSIRLNALGSVGIYAYPFPSKVTCNYCIFEYLSGSHINNAEMSAWTFNNCIIVNGDWVILQVLNKDADILFNNCLFWGNGAVNVASTATLVTIYNCIFTTSPTLTRAALTNCQSYISPQVANIHRNTLGRFYVRVDDTVFIHNAATAATILNPEVKVTGYITLHSVQNPPTLQNILDARSLIDSGNEVGSHAATHSDSSTTNCLLISATGTNPSVSIMGSRVGDSSTWSGTMTVTINGVSNVIDLKATAYNTIGKVVSHYNGLPIGDGVVACSRAVKNQVENLLSLCLDDISTRSIATASIMNLNDAAFVRYEWREAIADLQSYVRNGYDRNGANPCGAGPAASGSLSESYVVRSCASPYGNGRKSVLTDPTNGILTIAGMVGGSRLKGGDGNGDLLAGFGSLTKLSSGLFDFKVVQDIPDNKIFSVAADSCISTRMNGVLWHGTPSYNGSVANLKKLLVGLELGGQTFSEIVTEIRGNSDFNIDSSKATYEFNWDCLDNYTAQGNYLPVMGSPLIDRGVTISGLATDFLGTRVPQGGATDIGAYEVPHNAVMTWMLYK